ncbi:MAG: methyltransferase domain-containing protein [Glaciimonas sp.]|nr:methyltransferase domain-containing protein [Glaciimonas sp.]
MHDIVQDYYGRQLQHSGDLKTSACCDISQMPAWLKPLLARIHPEVLARYYGCGLVCPPLLEDCRVLDLGCGSGRDVYTLAQLVGPNGEVVGVDMTDEQLAVAEKHRAFHTDAFGYDNVRFLNHFALKNCDIKPQVIIGDNQQGIKTVAGNPGAIGYVSIGSAEFEAGQGTPIKLLPLAGLAQARRIANYAAFFWMKERVGKLIEFGRCRPLFETPENPLTAAYVSGMRG